MTNVLGIFIGIEDYFDYRVTKVKFACTDAESVYNAYLNLGCSKDNLVLLNKPRRTTNVIILAELKKLLKRSGPDTVFIFFFAGHGYRRNGVNYLTSVDSMQDDVEITCIKMQRVYQMIEDANLQRSIIFLDCCHSGIGSSDISRDDLSNFDPEEYEKTYLVTFAACNKDELSYTSDEFGHGIWSKYLLDALKGDADNHIYENGRLSSNKLQSYLREMVPAETYSLHKKAQMPQKYGHESHGEFMIADLNRIFEDRERVRYVSDFEFSGVEIWGQIEGSVKDLPGFPKSRGWKEPNQINDFFNGKIKDYAQDLVREKRDDVFNSLAVSADVNEDSGIAWFSSEDFDYDYSVEQSNKRPKDYVMKNTLEIKDRVFYKNLNDKFVESIDDNFKFAKLKRNVEVTLDKLNKILKSANFEPEVSHEESIISSISCYLPKSRVSVSFSMRTLTFTFNNECNLKEILEKCKEAISELQLVSTQKILKD